MKSRTLKCITAMTLFAALATPVQLATQAAEEQKKGMPRYTITDLGTLRGMFSQANGINNRGLVTGFSTPPGNAVLHAFRWQNGMMTDLGTLGGPNSVTPDDNHLLSERGQVVGLSETSTLDPNGEDVCGFGTHLICLPFVWQKSVMTPLPLLGGNNGQGSGINNRGQIVGVSETPNPAPICSPFFLQVEAAIWHNGNVQELPPFPGDTDGFASGINDNGQAVGFTVFCVTAGVANFRAVLWPNGPNGGVIDLGNLGGAGGNIAFDINNKGQVVGQSDLPGDTTHHAFLWQNGVMTDLGTILGLPVSLANGINNKGQIVGFSQDLNSNNTVAWLWQNGVMTDLNTLIPSDSPWFLIEALGINDRGQIAGPAFNTLTGDLHGFLATPLQGSESATPAARGQTSKSPAVILPENFRQLLQQRLGFGRFFMRAPLVPLGKMAVTSGPVVTLSPTSLTFPAQVLGTTSSAKTVTLKNTGNANLTITGINITGINPANFAQSHNCGSSLSAGASCTISVKFKPTAAGPRRAALSISDNAAGSPQKVTLSGIGVVSGPNATLSPTSLTFADQLVSTKSAGKSVKLTNYGTATLNITSITASGDFSQTHTCTSSLAPLAGCTINVTFKPAQIGVRTGTLSIADNAANTPQAVALSGTGVVSGPNATLSPTKLIFACRNAPGDGCQCINLKTTTLSDFGTTPLSITGITTGGAFSQTNNCDASLGSGKFCTITVKWLMMNSAGTVSVSDNASGSPQSVSLEGLKECTPP